MESTPYILVTGGAGYIGSHTVVSLIEQGYHPVIVDDFRNSEERTLTGIKQITGVDAIVHRIDVTDKHALESVFKQYDFQGVIHFAAYKAVGESVQKPIMYYRNNIVSLLNCVELCESYGVNNFVFSSSCTVYGEPDQIVVKESTPTKKANSPYGQTKQICEDILEDLHNSGSPLKILCLRYFNPVGAHPSGAIGELPLGVPNNLVPYVTQTAIGKLQELTVFGRDYATDDGTCIRDYIHVVDLAEAHLCGLRWLDRNELSTKTVVNIGTGKGSSVLEIIQTFEKVSGQKLSWKFGSRRPGDVPQIYADASLAKELLNWSAKYSLEDSMRDAWHWEQNLAHEN
jgi:UDP-glucose 4-epimerase